MHISIPIESPELDDIKTTLTEAANVAMQRLDSLRSSVLQLQAMNDARHRQLLTVLERITTMAQLNQASIDALSERIGGIATQVTDGVDGLRADIEELKAADVDTTALEARLDGLQSAADALAALDAENPTAAPEPAPEG